MTKTEYEQLKKLIQNPKYNNPNIFEVLKDESTTDLKQTIFEYRDKCINKVLREYTKLNYDDIEKCFVNAVGSLSTAIGKGSFQWQNENSLYNYLLTGTKNQAYKTWQKKKKYESFIPIDVLNKADSEDGHTESQKEKMRTAVLEALKEIKDDCRSFIEQFFLDEKSHEEMVNDNPILKNEKNSSAKINRCLSGLRKKAVELFKKNELNTQN